jgi:hypothetical protein
MLSTVEFSRFVATGQSRGLLKDNEKTPPDPGTRWAASVAQECVYVRRRAGQLLPLPDR